MTILLNSGQVLRWMAGAIFLLVFAHVAIQTVAQFVDADFFGIEHFFDLDAEANLPTFYGALALLMAAAILGAIARLERDALDRKRYWSGLAIIFAVLAVDEAATIHEMVSSAVDAVIETSGYFYYSWVIPYTAIVIMIFLLYARFLFRLPSRIKVLMIAAGLIFVIGALGLEAVSARHDELSGGEYDLTATVLAGTEETLEMVGVALFIYALLAYTELVHGGLEIAITRLQPKD